MVIEFSVTSLIIKRVISPAVKRGAFYFTYCLLSMQAELFSSLKPGGIVAVVDHHAAAGSPRESGGSLHRIDPDIVLDEMQSAGIVLHGKSDILRHMEDDYSLNMSGPKVRGKTHRFVFKSTKPY